LDTLPHSVIDDSAFKFHASEKDVVFLWAISVSGFIKGGLKKKIFTWLIVNSN